VKGEGGGERGFVMEPRLPNPYPVTALIAGLCTMQLGSGYLVSVCVSSDVVRLKTETQVCCVREECVNTGNELGLRSDFAKHCNDHL
jgi:hypothetical protein